MAEFAHMISVDWLEVFGHLGYDIEPGSYVGKSLKTYIVEDTGLTSKVFRSIYTIKYNNYQYATLLFHPASSIINQSACCLKLDNRILYHQGFISVLYDLLSALQIKYKGVTRLDLCLDCNNLADGTPVPQFLHDLMFCQTHTAGHVYRKGSQRINVECRRSATSGCSISAMRWGSRASNICVYCYNKSLEMAEVKIKPWIVESWERNGLKHEIYDAWNQLTDRSRKSNIKNGTTDKYIGNSVWRFEISIKSEGRDILNMSDGELFTLSPRFLECQEKIESLFWVYAEKYLCFYKSTGQTNTRCYPRYYLFGEDELRVVTDKPINLNHYADTGRTELIAANVLDKLASKYSDLSEQYSIILHQCVEFLTKLAGCKKYNARLNNSESSILRMCAEDRLSAFDGLLMEVVNDNFEKRRYMQPESLYTFTRSLMDSINDMEEREWAQRQLNSMPSMNNHPAQSAECPTDKTQES